MLHKKILSRDATILFDALAEMPELASFVLVGGTALALQIGHRKSLDLDFWLPAHQLNKKEISEVLRALKNQDFSVNLMTPSSQISQAKINGLDLLGYVQDYEVNGVKVTFFSRNDAAYQVFQELPRVSLPRVSFSLMSIEGIFQMKSWLIHQRLRSRDLYDLYIMNRDHGFNVQDILEKSAEIDPAISMGHGRNILSGLVPLDKEDEGLSAISTVEDMDQVFAFFKEEINKAEIENARAYATQKIKY